MKFFNLINFFFLNNKNSSSVNNKRWQRAVKECSNHQIESVAVQFLNLILQNSFKKRKKMIILIVRIMFYYSNPYRNRNYSNNNKWWDKASFICKILKKVIKV